MFLSTVLPTVTFLWHRGSLQDQKCHLKLGSWIYDGFQVSLTLTLALRLMVVEIQAAPKPNHSRTDVGKQSFEFYGWLTTVQVITMV